MSLKHPHPMLGSPTPTQAERHCVIVTHRRSSAVHVGAERVVAARVAKGGSELALVDINELIRFRDKVDAPLVKAVFKFSKRPTPADIFDDRFLPSVEARLVN